MLNSNITLVNSIILTSYKNLNKKIKFNYIKSSKLTNSIRISNKLIKNPINLFIINLSILLVSDNNLLDVNRSGKVFTLSLDSYILSIPHLINNLILK